MAGWPTTGWPTPNSRPAMAATLHIIVKAEPLGWLRGTVAWHILCR